MRVLFYSLSCLLLFSCASRKISMSPNKTPQLIAVEGLASDSLTDVFKGLTEFYRDSLGKQMNELLFLNPRTMRRGTEMDSLYQKRMWNWISDAILWYSKDSLRWNSDICLLNKGGFRRDIDSGRVLMRDIFELLPFENFLVEVELDADAFEEMKSYLKENLQPQSGLRLGFLQDQLVSLKLANSDSLLQKTVKVVTINYLADGGDYMAFFKDKPRKTSNILIRDAMIAYLRAFPYHFPIIDSRTYVIE